MKYAVFKNVENEENTLYAIAENDTDLQNIPSVNMKTIQISDTDFNELQTGKKYAISFVGDVITYRNSSNEIIDIDNFNQDFNHLKNQIETWLNEHNESNPFYTRASAFKTVLDNVSADGITFPLNKTLLQHLIDSGQTVIVPLQLR